jgi:hypothetical protein
VDSIYHVLRKVVSLPVSLYSVFRAPTSQLLSYLVIKKEFRWENLVAFKVSSKFCILVLTDAGFLSKARSYVESELA